MERKYQIFVSSTYNDLKDERKNLQNNLFLSSYIPAGMEYFGARNQNVWGVIQNSIENSDIFVLVIAGRYGTIDQNCGISYTEKEYNYAKENNIPILVFIRNRDFIKATDYDDNPIRAKLENFINRVENDYHVTFWNESTDLSTQVLTAIANLRNDRNNSESLMRGWVRWNPQIEVQVSEQTMLYYHIDIKVRGSVYDCERGTAVVSYTGSALVTSPENKCIYKDRVKTERGIQSIKFYPSAEILSQKEFNRNPNITEYRIKSDTNKLFFNGEVVVNALLQRRNGEVALHIPYFAKYGSVTIDISEAKFIKEYNGLPYLSFTKSDSKNERTPVGNLQFYENTFTYIFSAENIPSDSNLEFEWNSEK